MTEKERDAVLLRIEKKVDEITTSLADKADKADVDAVSDGFAGPAPRPARARDASINSTFRARQRAQAARLARHVYVRFQEGVFGLHRDPKDASIRNPVYHDAYGLNVGLA